MATNTQNQHVSTFIKGMDTDTSDMVLGADKYRYAENIRIVTNNEHNTGEVRLIEGAVSLFDIQDVLNAVEVEYDEQDIDWYIRESTSIRDYGILICEKKDFTEWFVVRYNNTENASDLNIKLCFGVCSDELSRNKLSIVTNYEDDDNIRLYIADGENKLMSINIVGNVIYNTIDDISDTTDSGELEPIDDVMLINGNLFAGKYVYYYQMYNKYGQETRVSPPSVPISINSFHPQQTDKTKWDGLERDQQSSLGVQFNIYFLPNYNHYRVYRVRFVDSVSSPTCELIIDSGYDYASSTSVTIKDVGIVALAQVDISSIQNIQYIVVIPKLIEAKNNRLFGSNVTSIKDQDIIDWDARSYSKGDYIYRNGNRVYVWQDIQDLAVEPDAEIKNDSADNLQQPYDASDWETKIEDDVDTGWNGWGKNIKWKYAYDPRDVDADINARFIKKPDYSVYYRQPLSFRRDELYRFGIVLYDKIGQAYPVKWIADIRMPNADSNHPLFITDSSSLKANNLYIKFLVDVSDIKDKCSGFEIVRCNLTINDRATITQGVLSNTVAYPQTRYGTAGSKVCPSGQITLNHLVYHWRNLFWPIPGKREAMQYDGPYYETDMGIDRWWVPSAPSETEEYAASDRKVSMEIMGHTTNEVLQFISPELSYSQDSVKQIIESNLSTLYLRSVSRYGAINIDLEKNIKDIYGLNGGTPESEIHPIMYYGRKLNGGTITYTWQNVISSDVGCKQTGTTRNYPYGTFDFYPIYLSKNEQVGNVYSNITYPSPTIYSSGRLRQIFVAVDEYNNVEITGKQNLTGSSDEWLYLFPCGFSQSILNRHNDPLVAGGDYVTEKTVGDVEYTHSALSDTYIKLYDFGAGIPGSTTNVDITWEENPDVEFVSDVKNSSEIDFTNIASLFTKEYVVSLSGGRAAKKFVPYVFMQGWIRGDVRFARGWTDYPEYMTLERLQSELASNDKSFPNATPIASAGPCMLFSMENSGENVSNEPLLQSAYGSAEPIDTFLCNLRKSVAPYGGSSTIARANSIYYGYGMKKQIGSDTQYNVNFDRGDCFLQCFEYQSAYKIAKFPADFVRTFSAVYSIPVETDIDLYNDYGVTWSKDVNDESMYENKPVGYYSYVQPSPCIVHGDFYSQDGYNYAYNTAYSANAALQSFTSALNEDIESLSRADCRTFYSELKAQNEPTDSWLKFKAANFLDVDSRYGQITDLKTFNNQLIYWQENAVGVFSVNEKQLLENADGNNLIIGTGDVLQRYDYISTLYGMKENQHSKVASNTKLYWWDDNKREIIAYILSRGIIELSSTKGVENYVNKVDRSEKDIPVLVYDPENSEVMFSLGDEESLVYNELLDVFTSIYKIDIYNKVNFKDNLQLLSKEHVSVWNRPTVNRNEENTSYSSYSIDSRTPLYPRIDATVNTGSTQTKTFDSIEFGGRFYGGGSAKIKTTTDYFRTQKNRDLGRLTNLVFEFETPTKQVAKVDENNMKYHLTNLEYDFKMSLPRNGEGVQTIGFNDKALHYGDRLKGKFMNYSLRSTSNDLDFSLQYIITKYRASWI